MFIDTRSYCVSPGGVFKGEPPGAGAGPLAEAFYRVASAASRGRRLDNRPHDSQVKVCQMLSVALTSTSRPTQETEHRRPNVKPKPPVCRLGHPIRPFGRSWESSYSGDVSPCEISFTLKNSLRAV